MGTFNLRFLRFRVVVRLSDCMSVKTLFRRNAWRNQAENSISRFLRSTTSWSNEKIELLGRRNVKIRPFILLSVRMF